MGRLKRVFLVLAILLSALLVLVFMLQNQQSVSLLFLGWTGPQLPVSVVAVIALLAGMIIGPVISLLFFSNARMRRNRVV